MDGICSNNGMRHEDSHRKILLSFTGRPLSRVFYQKGRWGGDLI